MSWISNLWGNSPSSEATPGVDEGIGTNTDIVPFGSVPDDVELDDVVDSITHRVARAIKRAGERKNSASEELETFRDYYMVAAINKLILTDILQKRSNTDDLISFTSPKPTIQKLLNQLEQESDWEQLITDILPDLLFSGEYHLRLDPVGYVEDDVMQGEYITAYKRGVVFGHYHVDKKKKSKYSTETVYTRREPRDLAHLSLNAFRERIDINAKSTPADDKVPSAIRVGVSYYRPVAALLASLRDSEITLDAAQLSNMASDNIVGIEMPANTPPAAALRITSRYQKMLNASKTALTQSGQLSVAKIISALGQIKVLPLYTGGGGNSKGSLNKIDVKNDSNSDDLLTTIGNKRDAILGTLGIPPGVIFAGLDTDSRQANTLKRYSRYSKSITLIQNGIIQGLAQLAYAYVASRTSDSFSKTDVNVSFNYKQPELSMLDHLEIVSTSLQSLQDLDEYLATLVQDETVNDMVTSEIRKEVIVRNLSLVIGRNLTTPDDGDDDNPFAIKKPNGEIPRPPAPTGQTPDGQQPPAPSGTESGEEDDVVNYTSDDIDKMWPEISREA